MRRRYEDTFPIKLYSYVLWRSIQYRPFAFTPSIKILLGERKQYGCQGILAE